MLIAHDDESGDIGDHRLDGSSHCLALGCVLVHVDQWNRSFEELLTFRRGSSDNFGPLLRYELKANHLIRNGGGLRRFNLSPAQRGLIYRYHLQQIERLGARAFAIVGDKGRAGVSGEKCLDMAWETLLQRLQRTTAAESETVMVIHDNGENLATRKILRRSRRHMKAGSYFGSSSLTVPLRP